MLATQSLSRLQSAATAAAFGLSLAATALSPASASLGYRTAGVNHRAPCTVALWASSPTTNTVYGYSAPYTICVTLTGFNTPAGLTTDQQGNLYVADLNNHRIMIYNSAGVFIKKWSTTLFSHNYQPVGICASDIDYTKSPIGVVTRYANHSSSPGIVEFFREYLPNNSTASGYASGIVNQGNFCAFDVKSNFFVDGPVTSGGKKIAYLTSYQYNTNVHTLTDSFLGTGSNWVGMYSRIDSPVDETLSVGTKTPLSTTQVVDNWKVGCTASVCTFTSIAPYSLTSYPSSSPNNVAQLAPTAGGSLGSLFIADADANLVFGTPAAGGAVVGVESPTYAFGVATEPQGQY